MQNDLISRQSLMAHFEVSQDLVNDRDLLYCNGVLSVIEREPSVDAVPVVRCSRCKHYEEDCGYCEYWETSRRTDDFCSRGEKMDGGAMWR